MLLFAATVEARKLEHHYPRALKVKYRESQHESSKIHVPTFWGSLYWYIIGISAVARPSSQPEDTLKDVLPGIRSDAVGLRVAGSGFRFVWFRLLNKISADWIAEG